MKCEKKVFYLVHKKKIRIFVTWTGRKKSGTSDGHRVRIEVSFFDTPENNFYKIFIKPNGHACESASIELAKEVLIENNCY